MSFKGLPTRQNPEPTKRRSTRLQRSALRVGIKPHVLDPAWMYEQEVAMILRALARYVHTAQFAPTAKMLATRRRWEIRALERYLRDMEAAGLAQILPGRGWMPTEQGFAFVNVLPAVPRYPTNKRARHFAQLHEKEIEATLACHDQAVNA